MKPAVSEAADLGSGQPFKKHHCILKGYAESSLYNMEICVADNHGSTITLV